MSDEEVGLPPTFKNALSEILATAAARDRTVIEFRTKETESGSRYLAHALDITDHVDALEQFAEDNDTLHMMPGRDGDE